MVKQKVNQRQIVSSEVAYAETTSAFSSTSTVAAGVQIPGLSVTFVADGVSKYEVEMWCEAFYKGSGGAVLIQIWDGALDGSEVTRAQLNTTSSSAIIVIPGIAKRRYIPSAGSHTINVGISQPAAGSMNFEAGSTFPAYISVRLV